MVVWLHFPTATGFNVAPVEPVGDATVRRATPGLARSKRTDMMSVALRRKAARLRKGEKDQWGHSGACNCGHLAQTLTRREPAAIYAASLEEGAETVPAAE